VGATETELPFGVSNLYAVTKGRPRTERRGASSTVLRPTDARHHEVMQPQSQGGPDPMAVAAALIACGVAVLYVWVMRQQNDQPLAWFLGGLILSVVLCGYGAAIVPLRRTALVAAGGIMVVLGGLGISSIGLPVLVAGMVALTAAARPRVVGHPRPLDR
jgi:hypothetical protein